MTLFENPMFASVLMVAWGIAVRYLPALKAWPNRLIPWMNVIIGLLVKLATPEQAHAGIFGGLGHSLGWMIVPFQVVIARQVFETWIRPTLEHVGVVGFPTVAKAAP